MRRGLLVLCLLGAACGGGGGPAATAWPDPPKDAVTKVTESGPVKATVQVWPAKPTLGDPMWLRLTVESAANVAATVPVDIDALGRFAVTGWDRRDDRKPDGALVQVRSYELAAPSSGKQRIPPLRIEILDQRGTSTSTSTSAIELLTDEVPIEIAPVLAAKTSAELRAARGELDPEVGRKPWWPYATAAAVALVLAVGGVVGLRRLRERRAVLARLSAYDHAIARLTALEAKGAPDEAATDGWFVELSSIVRRYLEDRFGLRAPELTTEEFLQEARRAPALTPAHREQLTAFLEECDRVKFAGYRPGADESIATLRAARAFIDDTRVAAEPPPAAVAHPRAA